MAAAGGIFGPAVRQFVGNSCRGIVLPITIPHHILSSATAEDIAGSVCVDADQVVESNGQGLSLRRTVFPALPTGSVASPLDRLVVT
jgi:hypothetical protein